MVTNHHCSIILSMVNKSSILPAAKFQQYALDQDLKDRKNNLKFNNSKYACKRCCQVGKVLPHSIQSRRIVFS